MGPLNEWLRSASASEAEEIVAWWSALPDEVQAEWARDEVLHDDSDPWPWALIRLVGRLVDEEMRRETREDKQQLMEYIANHEEVLFYLEERNMHICRSHAGARAVIRKGVLPASFACPLQRGDCPMRNLLKVAGGALALEPVLIPAR